MGGSFLLSVALHVVVGVAMIWATGPHKMSSKPLPSATVVRLVRPKLPPPGIPIPSREGQAEETKPALEIPAPKKDKEKTEPKTTSAEKPKPAPVKKEAPRAVKSSVGTGGKELVGKAGTMHVGGEGFEYDFYLAVVQSKIEQNFRPPPGVRGQTLATVAFRIEKNGMITSVTLAKSSGNLLIDQAAERAIRAAGRFPPLPPQYDKGVLDINFEFVVNPAASG
ncbi:TonB family protein [bacterium]|nr:TonB family protein [bacterium]MBU1985238.1 TonB family protein [bacterium]